jgi:nicotinate-nucleotide pyrophosphorylase (carboxylating)
MSFYLQEKKQLQGIIREALEEDRAFHDATEALFPRRERRRYVLRARQEGVFCGQAVAPELFRQAALPVKILFSHEEGRPFQEGQSLQVFETAGPLPSVERILLNILQHLTAIATETALWAAELKGFPCRLLDTRKTTPGWRYLEKHAVRCGGGGNHRFHLEDAVMIKDNHLDRAGRPKASALTAFIRDARSKAQVPVIVEVETLEECLAVAAAEVAVILLDNMSLELMAACVRGVRENCSGGRPLLEASGGLRREDLKQVARTGVDRISVGALTQNPPRVDLGLDLLS